MHFYDQRCLASSINKNSPPLSLFYIYGHFSRWTWISQYLSVSILDIIGAKDDVGRGDNWSYRTKTVKFHQQQTNSQFFTALPVAQPTVSKH